MGWNDSKIYIIQCDTVVIIQLIMIYYISNTIYGILYINTIYIWI